MFLMIETIIAFSVIMLLLSAATMGSVGAGFAMGWLEVPVAALDA